MDKKEEKVSPAVRVLGLKNLVLLIASFNDLDAIARLTTIQKTTCRVLQSPAAEQFYRKAFNGALAIKRMNSITLARQMNTGIRFRSADVALCCVCWCRLVYIARDDCNLRVCCPGRDLICQDSHEQGHWQFSRGVAVDLYRQTQKNARSLA